VKTVSVTLGQKDDSRAVSPGFTLIEVLVVVALIGLMAMIMTIAVSKTLKRQRLETAAHEVQSFLNKAYTTTTSTGRSVFVWVGAPASDGSRTMRIYDDTNNNGVFDSSADVIIDTRTITGDLVVAAAPSSTTLRSWPATGTSNTFIIECDTMGRAIDPPNSSTNGSSTTGVPMTLPAALSLTHAEMASGNLRPTIVYYTTVNLLWQPTIQKWVNNRRMS